MLSSLEIDRREYERTLKLLAETATALKAALHGDRTWVEWDVLRDSWAYCQARGELR